MKFYQMPKDVFEKVYPKRLPGNIIPLYNSNLFKSTFADPNHLERLESLLSICLNINETELHNNITLLTDEEFDGKNGSMGILDVIIIINYPDDNNSRINVEIKMDKPFYNQEELKLNLLSNFVIISFNYYDVQDNYPYIIDDYYLKDDDNNIVDYSFNIKHINIAKANELWYKNELSNQEKNQD